jgi:hypothetical protein
MNRSLPAGWAPQLMLGLAPNFDLICGLCSARCTAYCFSLLSPFWPVGTNAVSNT